MRALILSSGGIDSSTCLALAVERYGWENVTALAIYYGQKHKKEMEASEKIADYYRVEHICMDLSNIFTYSDCSLLTHSERDIPQESYAEQIKKAGGNPVSTYVPFRNGLFLSAAASVALSKECTEIYYGAHSDDAAGNAYPDCSDEFVQAMGGAIYTGSGSRLRLIAPFVKWNKAEVVKEGLRLGVPFELTWSCYEGGEVPCGKCGTCRDRAQAFALNGVEDPALL